MIESRKTSNRPGLPVFARGDNIAMLIVSRDPEGTQATGMGTGPGSESGAKAYGGFLKSWERHTAPSLMPDGMTPAHQRPGARIGLSEVRASEYGKQRRSPPRGTTKARGSSRWGSLRGLIVAIESRRTAARGSLGVVKGTPGERYVFVGWPPGRYCLGYASYNCHQHIADSAEEISTNTLPEEPDALIALVRVCGGVGA